jgi:hypothetical protein
LLGIIFKLVNQMKRSELFSVPLAQETLVEFKERGRFQVHLVGPRFTTAFAGVAIRLINASNNQAVRISRSVFPMSSSGLIEVRMLYGSVIMSEAGRYVLSVQGLKGGRDYTGCRILVTHPYTLYAMTCFIGIMLSGFGFIIGLVMSLIYLGKTQE